MVYSFGSELGKNFMAITILQSSPLYIWFKSLHFLASFFSIFFQRGKMSAALFHFNFYTIIWYTLNLRSYLDISEHKFLTIALGIRYLVFHLSCESMTVTISFLSQKMITIFRPLQTPSAKVLYLTFLCFLFHSKQQKSHDKIYILNILKSIGDCFE